MTRRIATLLVAGALAAAGAAGCGEDEVEQGVDRARDEAGQATEKGRKAVDEAAEKAKGAARDAADGAKKDGGG